MLIHVDKLTKAYRDVVALRDCSLSVGRGEIFGLLGPNGAGKTTFIRLLLGFIRPTSGVAQVDGLDCYRDAVRVHEKTAYLPGDVRLFRRMTAVGYLEFVCALRQRASLDQALQLADELDLDMRRRVAYMSTGMRQKLALVGTLAANADLIILDEPTANLDPNVRATVGHKIREVAAAGTTVLFSSHVLPEVEAICDRVAIMKSGELATLQRIEDLLLEHRMVVQVERSQFSIPEHLQRQVTVLHQSDDQVVLQTPASLTDLLGWLSAMPVTELEITRVGLQSLYDDVHPPATARAARRQPDDLLTGAV
ncbi:MAG: ATP-binding cassette domain-containing protein [Planctomycetota bacterium]